MKVVTPLKTIVIDTLTPTLQKNGPLPIQIIKISKKKRSLKKFLIEKLTYMSIKAKQ